MALLVLFRGRSCLLRALAIAGIAVALLAPAVGGLRPADIHGGPLAPGARLWRRGSTVVLDVDDASPAALLAGIRRHGVRRLDVLIVERAGRAAAATVAPLLQRVRARLVLAPPGTPIARAVVPDDDSETAVGPFVVTVESARPRLRVTVDDAS